ncbi:hypothetical protein D3C71_1381710 [compost metagenome]
MIFGKPRKSTAPITVTPSVTIESVIALPSGVQSATATPSGAISPAIRAATGTSSSPIVATIAPITAGGKTTSIHFVPA